MRMITEAEKLEFDSLRRERDGWSYACSFAFVFGVSLGAFACAIAVGAPSRVIAFTAGATIGVIARRWAGAR